MDFMNDVKNIPGFLLLKSKKSAYTKSYGRQGGKMNGFLLFLGFLITCIGMALNLIKPPNIPIETSFMLMGFGLAFILLVIGKIGLTILKKLK